MNPRSRFVRGLGAAVFLASAVISVDVLSVSAQAVTEPVTADLGGTCVEVLGTIAESPIGPMAAEGSTVYGSDIGTDELQAIDTSTLSVVDQAAAGNFPLGVAIAGGKAYVPDIDGVIWVIDLATFDLVTSITGLGNLGGPAAANGKVYITSSDIGGLIAIDPATDVPTTVRLGVGGNVENVNGEIWVLGGANFAVIDPSDDSYVGSFPVGGELPTGATWLGDRGYINNAISNDVSVIDLATHALIGTPIPVSGNPRDVEAYLGQILVTGSDDGVLEAIDPTTLAVTTVFDFGEEDAVDRMVLVDGSVFVSGNTSTLIGPCEVPPPPTTEPTTTEVTPVAEVVEVAPRFTG